MTTRTPGRHRTREPGSAPELRHTGDLREAVPPAAPAVNSTHGARGGTRTHTTSRSEGLKTGRDRPCGVLASVVWPVIWGLGPCRPSSALPWSAVSQDPVHIVCTRQPARSGCSTGQLSVHGLATMMPVSVKSLVFRVASTASWLRQIAAICASAVLIGRPARSRRTAMWA
jgi:hypothetical protein